MNDEDPSVLGMQQSWRKKEDERKQGARETNHRGAISNVVPLIKKTESAQVSSKETIKLRIVLSSHFLNSLDIVFFR